MAVLVESCKSLYIGELQKTLKNLIKRDNPEATTEEIHAFTQEKLNNLSINDQTFEFVSQPNCLGGYFWFFICSKCKKRTTKLFLPPMGSKNREYKYYCKACHRLKNQSSLNSSAAKLVRPLKEMKEIEDRLVRGHLTPEKVKELLDHYEALETELKGLPEYRLFSFKKKHGMGIA